MFYLVTLKLPSNPEHDPHNKKSGPCPLTGKACTDITGVHHTTIMNAETLGEAMRIAKDNMPYPVTRIEEM